MTITLTTLQRMMSNLIIPSIKEKHKKLNLSNLKLRQALSLDDPVVEPHMLNLLHALGYHAKVTNALPNHLVYTSKESLSKTWLLEIDRALSSVRSKSVIAMREMMHESASSSSSTGSSSGSGGGGGGGSGRKKKSPEKLSGPHAAVKCGKETLMIPFSSSSNGMTANDLKKLIGVELGMTEAMSISAGSLKLILKGRVLSGNDTIATTRSYKMKVIVGAFKNKKKKKEERRGGEMFLFFYTTMYTAIC